MADTDKKIVEAGDFVVFTDGEYADFDLRGVYLALRDITEAEMSEQIEVHKISVRQHHPWSEARRVCFDQKLIDMGWISEVKATQVYCNWDDGKSSFSEL